MRQLLRRKFVYPNRNRNPLDLGCKSAHLIMQASAPWFQEPLPPSSSRSVYTLVGLLQHSFFAANILPGHRRIL